MKNWKKRKPLKETDDEMTRMKIARLNISRILMQASASLNNTPWAIVVLPPLEEDILVHKCSHNYAKML